MLLSSAETESLETRNARGESVFQDLFFHVSLATIPDFKTTTFLYSSVSNASENGVNVKMLSSEDEQSSVEPSPTGTTSSLPALSPALDIG